MAIAFRSTSGATGTGDPSVTVTKPTGTVEGDVLLFIGGQDSSSGGDWDSAGITELHNITGSGARGFGSVMGYKVATDSEPASYTYVTNDGTECMGVITCFSGVDTTDVINVESHTSSPSDGDPECPDVTTDADGCMIVRLASWDDSDFNDYPGSHTGAGVEAATGTGGVAQAYVAQGSAGATGTATFDISSSDGWNSYTAALNPAAGAGHVAAQVVAIQIGL